MKLNELQSFQGVERSAMRQWLLSQGMEQSGVEMLFRLFDKKNRKQGASSQELQTLEPVEQLLHNLAAQGINALKRTDQIAKQGQKKRDQKSGDKVAPIKKSSGSLDGIDMKLAASKDYDADPIDESMAYAMPGQDEEKETVTYSKTKKQGDASVTVSANADSMDELHDILRLAGIDFEKSGKVDDTPDHNDHDDHEEEPCDDCDNEEPDAIVVKGLPHDDEKPNYSTDKEVLINYLKDKMPKSV